MNSGITSEKVSTAFAGLKLTSEGISDDIKAAKRGCFAVRVCWQGERVSDSGFVDGDAIQNWRELPKNEECCKENSGGEAF